MSMHPKRLTSVAGRLAGGDSSRLCLLRQRTRVDLAWMRLRVGEKIAWAVLGRMDLGQLEDFFFFLLLFYF
jgi:hypothetical protein